jgi:hypothetical protein
MLGLASAACLACERRTREAPAPEPPPASGAPAAAPLNVGWPETGADGISVRRQRGYDLTGDGVEEYVMVSAIGPAYDSLDITLAITDMRGDTLWLDHWSSGLYFYYDPMAGKADSTVARIVRAHVDSLVHESRFTARGLPAPLARGNYGGLLDESVRQHLAEIDFRGRASLDPRDPMPDGSWERIDVDAVAPARARVVRQELEAGTTFMYYAGGEASHVIGWSVRENAFVRLFACC